MDALRETIDRGETGEKVPADDPAAAPLGTDDEAAGTSPDPEVVEQVQKREADWPGPTGQAAPYKASGRLGGAFGFFVVSAIAIAAVLLTVAFLAR